MLYITCILPDHTPQRRSMTDKMSPMRLLGASSREDSLNEINRKMQRALEETLTKNIHLQEVRHCQYVVSQVSPRAHAYMIRGTYAYAHTGKIRLSCKTSQYVAYYTQFHVHCMYVCMYVCML